MKGKAKRIFEGNVQILSQGHEKQREEEEGHKMFLHPWFSRMFWPHEGSVVLGKRAPIPQQRGAVGEHRGDQMFSAMDGPVPWLVYLQDKEKHKGLLEWKSNILVLALSWEWNWSCCSGKVSGSGRRAGVSSGAHKCLQLCPEPQNSSLTSVLAMLLLWEVVQKNNAKEKAGICKSQKQLLPEQ